MSRNPLTLGVVVSLLGEVDLERNLRRIVFQAEMILSNGEKKLFSWNGIRDIHFLPNQSSAVYIIIWGVQIRGFLVYWTLIRIAEKSMRIICESDWNRILWNIYSWTIPRITIPRIVLSAAWPVVYQNQLNSVKIDDVTTKMRIGSAISIRVI